MDKKYDFDNLISRCDSDSVKWNLYPENVLPLWVADMDFPSPSEIVNALQDRISHPFFGYGCEDEELREVIVDWITNRHGWKIQPDWLLIVPGVVTGMNWAIQSVLDSGENLGYQTPIYPPFLKFARNAEVGEVQIPFNNTDNGFQIDFNEFEKSIQNCSAFALCNPHNPVGRVFTSTELERIAEMCLRYGVVICSDEIHCDLVYSNHRHIPIASLSEEIARNTITLMAPSKTFNIPGLEFSYAIVPDPDLRKKMENSRRGLIGHPNILGVPAAKAAYRYGEDWLKNLLVYLEDNRDFLNGYLQEHIPQIRFHQPEGTYLAWLDCCALNLEKDPYSFFLEEAKVGLNNGRDFGKEGEGFVRLNFATPRSNLVNALGRMEAALKK